MLLERGANVHATSNFAKTPLVCVLSNDFEGVVRLLEEEGANVNSADEHGTTPLMHASSADDEDLILAHGVSIASVDDHGHTAFTLAYWNGRPGATQILMDNGASLDAKSTVDGVTPFMLASLNDHREVALLLLDNEAEVNAANDKGGTSLMHACQYAGRRFTTHPLRCDRRLP